jgi:FAD dependent oxidoreductase
MKRGIKSVVDVMRIPTEGDAQTAVLVVGTNMPTEEVTCDILVAGGGMGGVAAALAAARRGHNVCLIEETDWLGGQMTSQGVSALDEHEHIESFGGTRSYYQMREMVRQHYRSLASSPVAEPINPGKCWVSGLAFEPAVAERVLRKLLEPEIAAGRLRIFLRSRAVAVESEQRRVLGLTAMNLDDGSALAFRFHYVIDATELGDLLPLSGARYVVGAESVAETGEPHAQPELHKAACVQSCSYVFAMERRPPGGGVPLAAPSRYEHYRDSQPYSLRIHVHGGEIYGENTGWLSYQLFGDSIGTKGPLWKYRRLIDSEQFPGVYSRDITMFNWPGNDYRDLPLVDQSAETLAQALQDAKRVALGFAHWLQTEAPTSADSFGSNELALRADVMATDDGLAKYPYIRECRRIKALKTIVEHEVAAGCQLGARAAHFADSVGVGWYPIDIHQIEDGDIATSTRTKPFQIPLGALIPESIENLLAGAKNIGTSHITNGCYRVHPVEWNVGEAAGSLAAVAIENGQSPKEIRSDPELLRDFQRELVAAGVPICWAIDVPVFDPHFPAVQRLAMAVGHANENGNLAFEPDAPVTIEARSEWISAINSREDPCGGEQVSRADFASKLADAGLI